MKRLGIGVLIASVVYLLGVLTDPPIARQTGLECPAQPFPIVLPPELRDTPGMQDFADYLDRQIEEIYLRFCFLIDSLKDSLVAADTLLLDSIGDCCLPDTLPDTDEGCIEYADEYRPCWDEITFDADRFWFKDDTAGAAGDAQGAVVDFTWTNPAGTKAITFQWPVDANVESWTIKFPDNYPGVAEGWSWSGNTAGMWTFVGSPSAVSSIYWEMYDQVYVQYGQKLLNNPSGTTKVALGPTYASANYRVQLTPVTVYLRETWPSTWDIGSSVRVWNTALWEQYHADTFIILHPTGDTGYVEWTTFGGMTAYGH